jgi:molybdate transport system substrate-binding protein
MFRRFIPYFVLLLSAIVGFTAHATVQHTVSQHTELKVITSGGFAAAFSLLAPKFEQQTGVIITTFYGSSSGGAADSIPVRLVNGETFDLIILSRSSLDRLTTQGFVSPQSRTDLVRSDIGMAVKHGAVIPDISTPAAFINTLLNAKSIGYSASASGTYLSTKLWPQLGIWPQIADKSQRILSERVARVVARGEVEIGFQQTSEILPIAGIVYVGPIPASLQKITTFSAGILRHNSNLEYAKQLIAYLASKEAAAIITTTGLLPVVLENPTHENKNNAVSINP